MPSSTLQARIAAFESGQPLQAPDSPPTTPPALLQTNIAIVPASAPSSPHMSSSQRIGKPPPLPPRKPSLTSLRSVSSVSRASLRSPTLAPVHSVSESLDVPNYPRNEDRRGKGHQPAASTSSFQSVSLESDGGGADKDEKDSLDGSFESVPSSFSMPTDTSISNSPTSDTVSLFSTSSKPRLPPRPSSSQSLTLALMPSSPIPRQVSGPTRRPAPPPPLKISSASNPTTPQLPSAQVAQWRNASTLAPSMANPPAGPAAIRRPTPVPPAARLRYDAVFDRNIAVQKTAMARRTQRQRRQEGWRGLSIDWNESTEVNGNSVERLRGHIIKTIWSWSKLSHDKLREIWREVDPEKRGSLDRDAFARGMWRIDEELSRAITFRKPVAPRSSVPSFRNGSTLRPTPPPPPRPMPR